MTQAVVAALITAVGGVIGALLARPKNGRGDRGDRPPSGKPTKRQARWFLLGAGAGLSIALLGFGLWWVLPREGTPEMSIVSPEAGASVPTGEVAVRGTWVDVGEGDAPRIVVYVPELGLFYPDAELVTLEEDGRWLARVVVGGENDAGKPFDIIVTTSDAEAREIIDAYLTNAERNNTYQGMEELPEGVTRHATVIVERE